METNRTIQKVAKNLPVEHQDVKCPWPPKEILGIFNIAPEEK